MSRVYVVGVSMTPFGKDLGKSVKQFVREAVDAALRDAGTGQEKIGAVFFANAGQSVLEGQHMIAGQVAMREIGFASVPVINVENACASASTAFHLACTHLLAGQSDVAMAVGVEKMFHEVKAKSFTLFDGAWDVKRSAEIVEALTCLGEGVAPPPGRETPPQARSLFMDIYAALARMHMKAYGTTERQLAAVASKNHHHSTMNPLSQYQFDMTVDDVLAARMVSWPLTLPMCSPISDGAAAAILCTEDALKRFEGKRGVKVLASILGSSSDRGPLEDQKHIGRLTAQRAYERAGVEPRDIDVAEVHDASAYAEIQQCENLGFCEPGQGGWIAERGETSIGGRIPVNPSGGLESKGHPLGATGLAQIYELVTQLRHEAGPRQVEKARLAIAENGGGFHRFEEAVAAITILGRAQ
jgi:acetyl-CoA acyltransferase